MIRDVLDSRAAGWVKESVLARQGPTKLEELHQQARLEQRQKEWSRGGTGTGGGVGGGGSSGRHFTQTHPHASSEGWELAANKRGAVAAKPVRTLPLLHSEWLQIVTSSSL